MRDGDKLRVTYTELAEIHIKSFPDMRFGQFWLNVMGWIQQTKRIDPFFPESEKFVEYAKEYANNTSPFFQGWDLSVYKGEKNNEDKKSFKNY